jgi:hypothetical protein
MANFAVRGGLVVIAVLAVAWLAFGLRAVRLEDQAQATVDRARAGPVSAEDVRRARDKLQEAKRFSADQGPVIQEAALLEAAGDDPAAALIARVVTLREPDNLQAWFIAWSADKNPETKEQALDQLRRLNPYIEVAIGLRECITCPLKPR